LDTDNLDFGKSVFTGTSVFFEFSNTCRIAFTPSALISLVPIPAKFGVNTGVDSSTNALPFHVNHCFKF
jgi:hypothetical protein